jgi:hypothetical protein
VVAWNRALEAGAQDRDTILRKIRQAGATDQIAAEDAREQDDVPQR